MKYPHATYQFLLCLFSIGCSLLQADNSNGLAPEVTDLNAKDISYTLEKKIPYLKNAFVSTQPQDIDDGIKVGKLGADGRDVDDILSFIEEIKNNKHNNTDSLLIAYKGELLLESYYKRGRSNYPHYQMSITKSYTTMAIGRAIQLSHLKMSDLQRPVISFLKDIDRSKITAGTETITLHEAMHMRSGIRVDKTKAQKVVQNQPNKLKGQGQIQTYMELSSPITKESKTFKYQGSDPSMAMQVLEAVVPGSAKDFIQKELLAPMGIVNYGWQDDVSGLPKSAAGSSWRSRDMLKMGLLIMQKGQWQGKQHLPKDFVEVAISPIDINEHRTYGYFWWGHQAKVHKKNYHCISGRGAGGQFILMFPKVDLIIVSTAHNKGMGTMLTTAPERIIPSFIK
ncbi:serine hydrolase [Lentisphaera marina]|uniref:serine hydrolase domain-containing protein n=1 Tax=Lentisphaera marina TaxID=1111041 RepID=UPI0023650164|nr:serine hydrolase [Lentisphaera marina]MDD7985972.1 serine hydrolase [Lentisphaera marina]